MGDTAINYKAVVLYGVLIAIAILVVLYLLNTPVKPAFDTVGTWISARLASINFSGFDIGKLISENMTAIIGVGITGITALITYARLRSQVAQNQELLETQKELVSKNLNLEGNVKGLTTTVGSQVEELKMYSEDKTSEILQGRIGEMQTVYEDRIQKLEGSLEQASKTPAQMLETLWQGSGNKVIKEGEHEYRVIELVKTSVK